MEFSSTDSSMEVGKQHTLTFPLGIPGFDSQTHYRLHHEEENPKLFSLISIDEPAVEFAVANPTLFRIHYQITLTEEETGLLHLTDPIDAAVLVMLYQTPEGEPENQPLFPSINANFLGPLIINTTSKIGIQKVLNTAERFVTIQG
ncbi:MAG: flagellar assembly protein FliW [Methylococcales bacterium]